MFVVAEIKRKREQVKQQKALDGPSEQLYEHFILPFQTCVFFKIYFYLLSFLPWEVFPFFIMLVLATVGSIILFFFLWLTN